MLTTTEYIIFAGRQRDRCEAGSCQAAAGNLTQSDSCTEAREAEGKRNDRPKMRIWGMLSEEDEQAGFRLYLDNDWRVLLLCSGKTMAVFDPYAYTMPELQAKASQVIRVIRRNPFLVCAGRIHLCDN